MIQISMQGMVFQAPYLAHADKNLSYVVRPKGTKLEFTFRDKNGKVTVEQCDEFVRPEPWEQERSPAGFRMVPYFVPRKSQS